MKNQLFYLLPFCLFFLWSSSLEAQTNQARIFRLTSQQDTSAVATEILNYMLSFPHIRNTPTQSRLERFLATPLRSGNATLESQSCGRPEMRAYNNASGDISVRYDYPGSRTNKNLLIGALHYRTQNTPQAYVIHGSNAFDGFDLPIGFLQYSIILVATVCNDCPNNPEGQCISQMDILIADKNIL